MRAAQLRGISHTAGWVAVAALATTAAALTTTLALVALTVAWLANTATTALAQAVPVAPTPRPGSAPPAWWPPAAQPAR